MNDILFCFRRPPVKGGVSEANGGLVFMLTKANP